MSDAERDSNKNYERGWKRYAFAAPLTKITDEIPAKAPEMEVA